MVTVKIKTIVFVCMAVLSAGRPVLAAPVIKDFSSKGGRTTNKTGLKDTMYLVKAGDKITFTVKADGAEKFEWTVNKKVQAKAVGDFFVWTVPNEKGIWEIHLMASGGKTEAHQEWVVSTLAKAEAPDFFEYFTDAKWKDRTETDPWGRKLPVWKQPRGERHNTTRGFLDAGTIHETSETMTAPSTAAYGTWRWRCLRFPKRSSIYFGNGGFDADTSTPSYTYFALNGKTVGFTANPVDGGENLAPSHWGGMKGQWITQTVIRTKDGWYYRFIEGDLLPNTFAQENTRTECSLLKFHAFSNGYADGIEVYKDRYLWPVKQARHGEYVSYFNWTYEPARGYFPAEKRKGIILTGHDLRLKEIAELVSNKSVFKYDEKTRTADCYADLVIMGGSSLVIESETLRFHCTSPGGCYFRVKNGAELRILKSTVTSATEHPFFWMFTSDLNYERYKDHRPERVWGNCSVNFTGRLIIRDSVIKKSGWMLLHGARQLVLENTKFVDMVNVDKGKYGVSGGLGDRDKFRKDIGGKHAFQLFNRFTQFGSPPFSIKGCTFSGAGGPANINLIGSDHLGKIDIYDTDFSKAALSFKKYPRWFNWSSTWPTEKNCPEQRWFNGTFSLVNCKLPAKLDVQTDRAYVMPKYYLDVKVVDQAGKPVSGALVSVKNETDAGWPPENIQPVTSSFVDCIDEQLAWPKSTKWLKIRDINNCVRPLDLPDFLMKHAMCNTPGFIGDVTDIRKDDKGRIVHFTDRGYRHFCTWKYFPPETRATFEYDFTYGDDGLLTGYTRNRVCYPPTKGWWGWGRKSKYVYTLKYKRERGLVVGYTITEKWAGSSDRKVDDLEWYVPLKVKTGRSGQTPLPSDGLQTIVLTDFVQDKDGKKEFKYTITVEIGGKKKTITGVNPGPAWYRPDPNKPTHTITAVLDGKD